MTAVRPNPANLSVATRLPPSHSRNFSQSRSPSRSPVRKARFAARELDPLLKNLSPDATLEALQTTNTIRANQVEQDALAQSISDASESERELGIRAAIAAKKLREWMEEVGAWTWPSSYDRAWGAGFVPKQNTEGGTVTYLGCLPETVVKEHEDRLDEIWDAIETLGIEEIKDYVFSSHHPSASRTSTSDTTKISPSGYGRMRDFTALITAIVIQALPVLANLRTRLETWSIRLTVLRQIPQLLLDLERVKQALNVINEVIRDEQKSRKLSPKELETGKIIFGNRVSKLGKGVDKLLDMLEGQEDSLPQAWIDSLEDIENKYAEWVALAEQVVLRNQMAREEDMQGTPTHWTPPAKDPNSTAMSSVKPDYSVVAAAGTLDALQSKGVSTGATVPEVNTGYPKQSSGSIKRKPLLEVNPRAEQGHKRGVSEVSIAESALSGYSLENAEIVDAQEVPVLPSPRISVIENPFPSSKNGVSWMGKSSPGLSAPRPGLLQRASTASIEIVPRESIREVTLRRSASHDMLSSITEASPGTPRTRAFHQLTAASSATATPQHEIDDPTLLRASGFHDSLTPLAVSPSPSLMVDPLSIRGKQIAIHELDSRPSVPRRSSKRLSLPLTKIPDRLPTPSQPVPVDTQQIDKEVQSLAPVTSSPKIHKEETFDDRLKSILASIPTKIKLTESSDSDSLSGSGSESSTRASSPIQTLKLSPVKDGTSGRNTTTSGIHVYHLSKTGKSRDTPPIKLFVRAVGENGERVMVRVGGGWADLAEYLREYSLHHGGRGLSDKSLEVASFPGKHQRPISPMPSFTPAVPVRDATSAGVPTKSNVIDQSFDFGLADNSMTRAVEEGAMDSRGTNFEQIQGNQWSTPPVPAIPTSYTSPSQSRGSSPNNRARLRASTPTNPSRPRSRISANTTTTPSTTTTTVSSSPSTNNYTPLGAAGPVQNTRRIASYNLNRAQAQSNDTWVEGMVNQARAVSGSHIYVTPPSRPSTNIVPPSASTTNNSNPQVVQHPTITTTTTITSPKRRPPGSASTASVLTSRKTSSTNTYHTLPRNSLTPTPANSTNVRPSAVTNSDGSHLSQTSSGSSASYATANTNTSKTEATRSKSRMSLADVSGIRRVFLRKKSDK
ncbi:hypothetical protein H2198_002380 [Neophaeococcomyces mojaviensis]|uniref:Uncharacterized protein n=1 Tax=Neophaeococcomyces mojaviensis TaxID=3383035 RepID=A0ACC3AE55_9EURO|nr:hypothetical protein H2198_002380 [Knufia sp. JES_112]